jgi:hypothetical protein
VTEALDERVRNLPPWGNIARWRVTPPCEDGGSERHRRSRDGVARTKGPRSTGQGGGADGAALARRRSVRATRPGEPRALWLSMGRRLAQNGMEPCGREPLHGVRSGSQSKGRRRRHWPALSA